MTSCERDKRKPGKLCYHPLPPTRAFFSALLLMFCVFLLFSDGNQREKPRPDDGVSLSSGERFSYNFFKRDEAGVENYLFLLPETSRRRQKERKKIFLYQQHT